MVSACGAIIKTERIILEVHVFQVKTFFIGVILIGLGVLFGDPVPQELSVRVHETVENAGKICSMNSTLFHNHNPATKHMTYFPSIR